MRRSLGGLLSATALVLTALAHPAAASQDVAHTFRGRRVDTVYKS